MKKSLYALCALLTASALMMTGCEGIEITVTDYTSPSMQHTTTTTTNKETPIPDDDTDEDSSPDLTEEEYTQNYPVQDYQLGYAEVLSGLQDSIETNYTAYLLHIDEDETPELAVVQLSKVTLYSFTPKGVYEFGTLDLNIYNGIFYYRPYLSITGHTDWQGGVMNGFSYLKVTTYTHEPELLKLIPDEEISFWLTDIPDDDAGEEYAEAKKYGFGAGCSDSWKSIKELPPITKSQIEYWLTNWAT